MDTDPSIARITFDIPRRDVPELLAHLGSFALDHNIDVRIGDAPQEADHHILAGETSGYDPELVVMIPEDGKEMIPVVTRGLLDDFARSQGKVGVANKLVNGLGFGARKNNDLKDMLYGKDRDTGYRATGIRVSHIKELRRRLDEGEIKVQNIGSRSIQLLNDYCAALFPEDTTDRNR